MSWIWLAKNFYICHHIIENPKKKEIWPSVKSPAQASCKGLIDSSVWKLMSALLSTRHFIISRFFFWVAKISGVTHKSCKYKLAFAPEVKRIFKHSIWFFSTANKTRFLPSSPGIGLKKVIFFYSSWLKKEFQGKGLRHTHLIFKKCNFQTYK